MTLIELQNEYKKEASKLGDYQSLTKLQLANGYCDAEEAGNEIKRSAYWAALTLRYWYKIFEWKRTSTSLGLMDSDFVDWLNDALVDAFYYRSWRYPYKAIVRHGKFIEWELSDEDDDEDMPKRIPNDHWYLVDPDAADRSINYFCSSKRGKEYQEYNKDKRRANIGKASLDQMVDEEGDCYANYAGAYVRANEYDPIVALVNKYLENNQNIEALIIDAIAMGDSMKETKYQHTHMVPDIVKDGEDQTFHEEKYNTYGYNFDARRAVKQLSHLDRSYMLGYFTKHYEISEEKSLKLLEEVEKIPNQKWYKYIDTLLGQLRKAHDLTDHLGSRVQSM